MISIPEFRTKEELISAVQDGRVVRVYYPDDPCCLRSRYDINGYLHVQYVTISGPDQILPWVQPDPNHWSVEGVVDTTGRLCRIL
jgi:hypothetical protein